MNSYTHLSLNERKRIFVLNQRGLTIVEISKRLKRHRSTIYRELNRNSTNNYYLPDTAHRLTQARYLGRPFKIKTNTAIYDYILRRLKQGWSPEQIAGRMRREKKPIKFVMKQFIAIFIENVIKGCIVV